MNCRSRPTCECGGSQDGQFQNLLFLGHRAHYLDPTLGRWTTQDPLGFAAGDANPYRYVGNRATLAMDPSVLAEQPHLLWDYATLRIYPVGRSVVAWWQGWHLNAQLDEVQHHALCPR